MLKETTLQNWHMPMNVSFDQGPISKAAPTTKGSGKDKSSSSTGVDEPLNEVHVLREASDGTGHVGGVDSVPHGPVDVWEAIWSSHEQHQRGILLVGKVVGCFITKNWEGDNNINFFIFNYCLNFFSFVC